DVYWQRSKFESGLSESIRSASCRPVFNQDVFAFDVAKIAQTLTEVIPDRLIIYDADGRELRRLLRARHERPGHSAAEPGYQFSPPDGDWHVTPHASSAWKHISPRARCRRD